MPDEKTPPLQGAYFGFELDGIQVGYFTQVTGLSMTLEVKEHQTMDKNSRVLMKIPGHRSFPQIGLHRGLTTDMTLQDWLKDTIQGRIERKTAAIVIYDRDKKPQARFSIDQAYPSHMDISEFSVSEGGKPVIETMLIQHDLLTWDP